MQYALFIAPLVGLIAAFLAALRTPSLTKGDATEKAFSFAAQNG